MPNYLFHGSLADLDPDVYELTQIEAERQYRKLILIPSESAAPLAVREALSCAFQNIYAEGYPDEETRLMTEAEIFDYTARLGHFRRYADPRYYKGVEYADVIEALARRRCAELFAANDVAPDEIYVNVQALSGGPANNAVYHALVNPGDTVMGLNLLHGGHLSHGSPVNRSGKYYNIVSYTVDPSTEQLDYETIRELALQEKPRFIIAGYSSYPWMVDWNKFKAIADEAGSLLMADIAHVAGLVAAGVYPSPVGYADVITFTTHKSLCGPRGACILTTNFALARKLDRAVFPGEQGGPHVNTFAAMALAFKLGKTEQFKQLQQQIVKNCVAFTERFKERSMRIPFGGTNTHLMNLDTSIIKGRDGTTLSGDMAARILDLVGVVVNRNTIPGDKSALDPNGIRMGTPWITQRGFKEADVESLADIIADLLQSCAPFSLEGRRRERRRAKVDFSVLEDCKLRVRALAESAGVDYEPTQHGYPHFWFLDDTANGDGQAKAYLLSGDKIRSFVNFAFASDVEALQPGQSQPTQMHTPKGTVDGALICITPYEFQFIPKADASLAASWLRDLSDGYVSFDDDQLRKLPGPVAVLKTAATGAMIQVAAIETIKPYFIGAGEDLETSLPEFVPQNPKSDGDLHRTPLFDVHKSLGARMVPFAGWEMPVQYTSILEEHQACRNVAGLFDVSHMGVYQAEGHGAALFLDGVCGNDIFMLAVGESCYTHFLDPDANVIDDLLVYRRDAEKFLVVVNAANDHVDWAWLNAVKDGEVLIERSRPGARTFGRDVLLRNLRDPSEGSDQRVDIALQGPKSRQVLLALGCDDLTHRKILTLKRSQLSNAVIGGFDLIVSRTGYTGEKMGFELFVHPDQAVALFKALHKVGEPLGLKPCGLGARDSLRTEAGLPLYGHEMGLGSGRPGSVDLGVAEAGFGRYIKIYKPWFIGRQAFLQREESRQGEVIRFRFVEKGVRIAHQGDPVLNKRGKVVGFVTSCAIDCDGMLTGLAFVSGDDISEGTQLMIYQSASGEAGKAPAAMKPGDKVALPTRVLVVSRFLK